VGDASTSRAKAAEALIGASDHVDRLLSAGSVEQALELAAELVLAVSGASGVQLFVRRGEELADVWAGGQLEGDESARRKKAAAALKKTLPIIDDVTATIPISTEGLAAAVVAEGGAEVGDEFAMLLSILGSRGVRAATLGSVAEDQRALRLNLSRYVCPSVAVAISRGDHAELMAPEQRPISILVLLVDGLSAEVDLIGPARILPVVHQFYSTVTDAIYEREGAILEMSLDKIVAVFGAPIRADDATGADLAAASGLRLIEGLATMAERFGVEGLPVHMEARVGVSTGPAMVGSFGSAERPVFSALGAQVTLARELAIQGAPGEMVVDSATRSLLAERLNTRSIGAVEVQGLDYPVFAYGAERGP